MSWTATDASGIASASVTIDGVTYQGKVANKTSTSTTFWAPINQLGTGDHAYTITAYDTAGNSGQRDGSFTLGGGGSQQTDSVNPEIPAVAVSQADGFMSWTATDASGIASASVTIDGVTYQGKVANKTSTSTTFWAPINQLGTGDHAYTITAYDTAGNSGQRGGSFALGGGGGGLQQTDSINPTIPAVAVSQADGFMSWTATDASGIASATVMIDTTTYQGNIASKTATSTTFWASISHLGVGDHAYTITAFDTASNSGQRDGSFTLTGDTSTDTSGSGSGSGVVSRNAAFSGLVVASLGGSAFRRRRVVARNAVFSGFGQSLAGADPGLIDSDDLDELAADKSSAATNAVDAVMAAY